MTKRCARSCQNSPLGGADPLADALAEIERLRAERDLWESRCLGALWLVPEEKTCGELQEAARRARALLGAIERHAISEEK